jgi:hypothetical protein
MVVKVFKQRVLKLRNNKKLTSFEKNRFFCCCNDSYNIQPNFGAVSFDRNDRMPSLKIV